MQKLKVLDLFSGIGGFSLGLEWTGGFETVAFCEVDETAQKVLSKHWPDVPILNDVTSVYYGEGYLSEEGRTVFTDVDVICGGFPCQDISVAGKGEGLNGKRSGLWTEFKRLIKEVKPQYAIIENVANLRSKGLAVVLQDLWELGYDAEWHIISARSLGAPHLRERIWIIAYPNRDKLREQSGRRSRTEGSEETLSGEHGQDGINTNTNSQCIGLSKGAGESLRPEFQETVGQNSSNVLAEGVLPQDDREVTTDPRSERSSGQGEHTLDTSGTKKSGKRKTVNALYGSGTKYELTDTDHFRLWKPFTTEEAQQKWWAETASRISNWKEIRTLVCGVDDGLSRRLHTSERERRERIKQLGNSIVPQTAQLIGQAILEYESN